MCGILAWFDLTGIDLGAFVKMTHRVAHRGPNGQAHWAIDLSKGDQGSFFRADQVPLLTRNPQLAFGHRRLSILDLSQAGTQPMSSSDGSVWITFNGEIYNYRELRAELSSLGHRFLTETDTEVLIAAYQEWGSECVRRFNGMWAFVICDLKEKKLFISRDRFGVKPLYYFIWKGSIVFCSEIKQLLDLPQFTRRLNKNSAALYIQNGYEDLVSSYFEGVNLFPAASSATVSLHSKVDELRLERYWRPEEIALQKVSQKEAVLNIRDLFKEAVSIRLRSDVPVGVCLSGGVDSTSIYTQLNSLSGAQSDLRSFSACFPEWMKNERDQIAKVHKHTQREGYFVEPCAEDFKSDIENLIYHHDAPIYSASIYASYCVNRLARQKQTPVLLNGQGSDEVFSGYSPAYYLYLAWLAKKSPVRFGSDVVSSLLPSSNAIMIKNIPLYFKKYLSRKSNRSFDLLTEDLKQITTKSNWADEAQRLEPKFYRLAEIQKIHLPRLLRWDDRNSMAFGVEARYPFLDIRLVEYVLSIDPAQNMKRGWTKYLLRKALSPKLPKQIAWQKSKIGFEPPQLDWLRGGLRGLIQERLLEQSSSEIFKLVNKSKVSEVCQKVLNRPVKQVADEDQTLVFRLLSLDMMLSRFTLSI